MVVGGFQQSSKCAFNGASVVLLSLRAYIYDALIVSL